MTLSALSRRRRPSNPNRRLTAAATFYHVWAAMILRGMAGCKFAEGINDYGQGERRYVAIVADHRGISEGV